MVRPGPRRPANKNSPDRLPVALKHRPPGGSLAQFKSNRPPGLLLPECRGDRLRARRQPHPRLFINPPARLASGDHVRLRRGVPDSSSGFSVESCGPRETCQLWRVLWRIDEAAARERRSVLTSHGRGRVDVAPAPRQFFKPPGGNGLLKPGRCSDVVLGRSVEFLQSRKRL
jgi:hypothetical protein